MPGWAMAVMGVTALFFMFVFMSLNYSLGHVIFTLAQVETPLNDLTIHVSSANDDPDAPVEKDNLLDVEEAVVKVKPITSKIRTTMRHITSVGGFAARWRGLRLGLLYTFAFGIISNVCMAIIPFPPLASALAAIVTVPIHCAWTHATIAMPSNKGIRERVAFKDTFKKLWAPAVMKAAAIDTSLFIMIVAFSLRNAFHIRSLPVWVEITHGVLSVALAIFLSLFVIVPATAAFTRVEASLLPDDDEVIVPFDRTLGGFLAPAIYGNNNGFQIMKAALKSFDNEARRRIAKTLVKIVLIFVAVMIFMVQILAFELWILPGNAVEKIGHAYKS
ncbi:hypothetical protein K402DRAFT_390550 [Aulographum hederae CBS 113979]|uniref:Ubiquitin conjugating enzyme n=1 Tax=Aulographum hederae CBS 113979 TaxID=1176131 RepID=A0A6G1H8N8_9PEZI|nr:hypothetical protein K402DRAFT_390550 [Aulographum hederae CBS 113979]